MLYFSKYVQKSVLHASVSFAPKETATSFLQTWKSSKWLFEFHLPAGDRPCFPATSAIQKFQAFSIATLKMSYIQYGQYKGDDPNFNLSQWSCHVQMWHAQREQFELGSILSNFLEILNILASRRGWTFWGWNFSRFWRKNEVPPGQRNREWVGSETQKWRKNRYFWSATLFLELKLIKIYIFIHYHFLHRQNWSKSSRFFAYH